MVQERRAHRDRIAAARTVRRCRSHATRRRLREFLERKAAGAGGIFDALSPGRTGLSSVEELGRAWIAGKGASPAGRPEPLEPGQGPVVGAIAAGTRG